jgi:hypothetical protein
MGYLLVSTDVARPGFGGFPMLGHATQRHA